jgi:hypothetical protein
MLNLVVHIVTTGLCGLTSRRGRQEQPISSGTETCASVTECSCLLRTIPTRFLSVITQFLVRHCISVDFTQSQQLKQRRNITQPADALSLAPPRARSLYRKRVRSGRSNYPINVPTSAQNFISDVLYSPDKKGHNRCKRHTIGVP